MKAPDQPEKSWSTEMSKRRAIRLILFADTHLGFDYPVRPRIERRRRGDDFFANHGLVLAHARAVSADLVVHGGDLFFRSKVPQKIVDLVYESLFEFSKTGIDLFIVPGNHERSQLPESLLFSLPNVHLFDEPRTLVVEAGGARIGLSGFAFEQRDIGGRFSELVDRTGWRDAAADIRLLCLHQAVDGARVGPVNFTFRRGPDVVDRRQIPPDFAAVLCGHIHRQQILRDRSGSGRTPPVIYPGSTERTSFAEKDETKGFYEILFEEDDAGLFTMKPEFVPLPARPMVDLVLDSTVTVEHLATHLAEKIASFPADAVVRVKSDGPLDSASAAAMTAAFLRGVFPSTMNIQVSAALFGREGRWKKR